MVLESFIYTYAYFGVFVGTFFEGETILILAALAAHSGYLSLSGVIIIAFLGTICGDQFYFFLGRWHGRQILEKRKNWRARVEKAQRLFDRFSTHLILISRFLYGVRTVTPFIVGMSSVPSMKFMVLNAVGAAVWAIVIGAGGYLFGDALEAIFGEIRRYDLYVFIAIAILGVAIWALYFSRRARQKPPPLRERARMPRPEERAHPEGRG
jgi:membrane protein DedA with SNARE-associated domain